jgi:hypothetical protein
VEAATKEYLAKIGRRGGKARLTKMTAARRKEIAQGAAQARWNKQKKEKP